MNTPLVPPLPPSGIPRYSKAQMGEEAVVSARRQFGRKNSDWEFPIHFLGDEDELCQYCIHAFFSDRDNVAGYASMCQMMMHAPDELRAAIIAFYRSL